jgi:hypothetical protein
LDYTDLNSRHAPLTADTYTSVVCEESLSAEVNLVIRRTSPKHVDLIDIVRCLVDEYEPIARLMGSAAATSEWDTY